MTESQPWTIGRLLEWTTTYLRERGAETARLDAEVLLAHVRACQRIELYTAFSELPSDAQRAAFRELVRRRAEGMPVAYLVGQREFYSLPFVVTSDVLIPRPETEFLVITLLDLARQRPADAAAPHIADVGTGSGILAVCAALHLPHSQVVATDLSAAALAVAKQNAQLHGVANRLVLVETDLLDGVRESDRFDFVVSNPPYIKSAEMPTLARDVRSFEPRLALEAGPRGTEIIERLIPQAVGRLHPLGWLIMEIAPGLEAAVRGLLAGRAELTVAPTIKDLAGLPRVIAAQRSAA